MLKVFLALSFLLIAVGCSDPTDDYIDKLVSDMQWLRTADPVLDANDAWKRNDFRYLAITSYSLAFPGLDSDQYPDVITEGEYRIIGYCELIEGIEHMELCKLAGLYAEKYNRTLLGLLAKPNTSKRHFHQIATRT